jgi:dihydroxy-acid dehydratase
LRDGDIVELDADKGTLSVKLSDDELAKRKAAWKPRESEYGSGYLWKYTQQVGSALKGAITHPGGAGEKTCYADS